MNNLKSLQMFTLTPKYKKCAIDENRLWDKKCPKCGCWEMMATWSWNKHKYEDFKCGRYKCDYEGKPK